MCVCDAFVKMSILQKLILSVTLSPDLLTRLKIALFFYISKHLVCDLQHC